MFWNSIWLTVCCQLYHKFVWEKLLRNVLKANILITYFSNWDLSYAKQRNNWNSCRCKKFGVCKVTPCSSHPKNLFQFLRKETPSVTSSFNPLTKSLFVYNKYFYEEINNFLRFILRSKIDWKNEKNKK